MVAAYRPDVFFGVAFNADPFDVAAVPVWSDLTTRCYGIGAANRGRQYELDQNQTGALSAVWHNADEALNPNNPSSPYAPNVVPYRQILARAMWPNGGTGNLLNPLYNNGFDPSFEAYGNGFGAPGWLTRVGGVTPTTTTTNPQQGTKSVTYTVASVSTAQGLSWVAPCIPGRQYTASAYVWQSTASTQQLAVGGQTLGVDTFMPRTVVNGWSTPSTFGPAWTTTAGVAADYAVTSGFGTQNHAAAASRKHCRMVVNALDSDQYATGSIPVMPTGAPIELALMARYIDTANFYYGGVQFAPAGTLTAVIVKRVAGVQTTIATTTVPGLTFGAGTLVTWRLKIVDTSLQLKVWLAGTPEPAAFTLTGTDTALTAAGNIGLTSVVNSGSTNTFPLLAAFDGYQAAGSIAGSSTATTGAYQRLTATFTATQPTHTIQVATFGAAVAGTVQLDALQHEPGATANAFTTTGPLIRNIWTRGYVERWPNQWVDGGFRGISATPCVGPFAILANADLHPEVAGSILAKAPTYLWKLQEPAGSTTFAESSGNNGPPLRPLQSKYGPGAGLVAGVDSTFAGNPDGTSVTFTRDSVHTSFSDIQEGTILSTGHAGTVSLAPLPPTPPSAWSASASIWMLCPGVVTFNFQLVMIMYSATSPAKILTPFQLTVLPNTGFLEYKMECPITAAFATTATSIADNKWHNVVCVGSQDATNTIMSVYVDGTLAVTTTTATSTVGLLDRPGTVFQIGAEFNPSGTAWRETWTGNAQHAAIWYRALSAAEIADMAAAGLGYAGETSGARIARQLALGGYTGPAAIQAGVSIMGPSTVKEGDATLATAQRNADSEFGNLYESADGVAFAARTARYLATSSVYTFGENVAGGEYPYEGDVNFDTDPHLVLNIADVTRTGGIKAHAEDTTGASQKRYGKKNFTRTIDIASDNETQDAATWTVSNRKDPVTRVAAITFNPAAVTVPFGDGTLWPMVLTLEIGTRVTVKRRPKAGNGGSGLTMSGDFFVEAISHHDINFEAGTWMTTLLLSPVNKAQPWILEHAVYGQLDVTTVLGF